MGLSDPSGCKSIYLKEPTPLQPRYGCRYHYDARVQVYTLLRGVRVIYMSKAATIQPLHVHYIRERPAVHPDGMGRRAVFGASGSVFSPVQFGGECQPSGKCREATSHKKLLVECRPGGGWRLRSWASPG